MIPFIIAGAVGFGIAKLLEKDTKKYAKGGGVRIGSDGREYPFGSAWALEHNSNNKNEDYEIPLNKRKFDGGGYVIADNSSEFPMYYAENESRFTNDISTSTFFKTKEDAQDLIDKSDWSEWAYVEGYNLDEEYFFDEDDYENN